MRIIRHAVLHCAIYRSLHTQKRHRPVTACCTFWPDTGMISLLYQTVVAYRLFRSDGVRVEQSVGLSGLYQSDVTEWYRYVGNRLLVSDKSGLINTDDKPTVLIQTVTIIAVTGVATLSWTDLISVLLNAVTAHAFFRVYSSRNSSICYVVITWN